ncbi:MAG: hypothetical protein R2762_31225 [Bryobacteraceae bacterium]
MVGVRSVRTVQPGVYLAPRGVFNAASLAPQLPRIAPGSMVSLFGSNLSASQTAASTTPIPAELGGVRVLLNGAAAPLLFASSQQVNFLVPWELAPGAVSIQVDNNGSLSNPARATVGSTSPAVFSMAGPGSPILAFHADSTLVSRLNPARPGETLVAYANGLGPVAPEVRSGDTTPLTGLSRVVGNLEILIDGRPARVDFAGLAPGMVDVYQLNFVIPEDITGYREVTLAIGTSDAFSDLAEIAVAPR